MFAWAGVTNSKMNGGAVLKAIEQYVPLPANPGSEVALRRTIDEIARDTPNYDLMTPEVGLTADNKTSWIQQGVCLQNGAYVDPRSVPRCRSAPGGIGEP